MKYSGFQFPSAYLLFDCVIEQQRDVFESKKETIFGQGNTDTVPRVFLSEDSHHNILYFCSPLAADTRRSDMRSSAFPDECSCENVPFQPLFFRFIRKSRETTTSSRECGRKIATSALSLTVVKFSVERLSLMCFRGRRGPGGARC